MWQSFRGIFALLGLFWNNARFFAITWKLMLSKRFAQESGMKAGSQVKVRVVGLDLKHLWDRRSDVPSRITVLFIPSCCLFHLVSYRICKKERKISNQIHIQYWELEVEQELFRRLKRNLDRLKKNKKVHSSKFNYLSNGVRFIKIGWKLAVCETIA